MPRSITRSQMYTELTRITGKTPTKEEVDEEIQTLVKRGLAKVTKAKTGGRSKTVIEFVDERVLGSIPIDRLQQECHSKGLSCHLWDKDKSVQELLCSIHLEVSKAHDTYNKYGIEDKFANCMAGILEKLLDISGGLNIDLGEAIKKRLSSWEPPCVSKS